MKCDRIREDLGAYLDNELDSARRSELDGHLASCEACTAELHRLRKLSKLVADVLGRQAEYSGEPPHACTSDTAVAYSCRKSSWRMSSPAAR